MRLAASVFRRVLRGLEYYSGIVFVSVMVPALLTGKPANPTWPEPTTPAGRYALLTLHLFSTAFLPTGFFTLVALLYGFTGSCTVMYHALGARLERAHDSQQVQSASKESPP